LARPFNLQLRLAGFIDICRQAAAMINFTKHSLQKLEKLFSELGYMVRYEKGTFNSGYCIVENRKIVIVNKFYETDGRIGILLDLLKTLEFEPGVLSGKSGKFLTQIEKVEIGEDEEQEV